MRWRLAGRRCASGSASGSATECEAGVEVDTRGVFCAGVPRPLFSEPYELSTPPQRNCDVGPDGRFVVVKRKFVSATPREIVLLEGWESADSARAAKEP